MVEAATEFRKSGFNDEDAANLALVATQYQNVADDAISAGEASNFIISQIKAFGIEAGNAQHIIDALNEVSNNFAVSSSDLSNNLGKASAALATGNTTYEETLGLFTGITEITRNASRAARGLVSIQSRLTQVLDDQSSTGKALIDIYTDLGIELFDSNGQIRSLYDILTDLSKQWDGLSTNQKDYIALTQAGANQTQNFLALMSNFETVTSATSTALNSTGSAMEENARVMESLEAKTNQLKATFQDLSNNVIENELIKSLLDLANNALGALNTEVGTVITQFGLLSAGLTGLFGVGKYFLPLIKGFIGGSVGWAVGIGAVVTGVYQLYKAWDEAHPTLEEANSIIQDNNAVLETNKQRLNELNNVPWFDRTPEIEQEIAKIEAENDALQDQIESYKNLNIEKAKQAAGGEYDVYGAEQEYRVGLAGLFGSEGGYSSRQDLINAIYDVYGTDSGWAEFLIKHIKEIGEASTESGEALETHLLQIVNDYNTALETNNEESKDVIATYNNNKETIDKLVASYKTIIANGGKLTDSQLALLEAVEGTSEAYSKAVAVENVMSAGLAENAEQAQALINKYPELKNGIEGCTQATLDFIAKNEIFANQDLGVDSKIRALYNLATAAGIAGAQLSLAQAAMGGDKRAGQALIARYGTSNVNGQIVGSIEDALSGYWESLFKEFDGGSGGGRGVGGTSSTKSSKTPEDLALKSFQSFYKDLQHQRDMDIIDEKVYYDKLRVLVDTYYKDATAKAKQYGLDEMTIRRNMYQYEQELYDAQLELQKKQQEALEEREQAFLDMIGYLVSEIDEDIDALNKQLDEIDQRYDDEIAKLEAQNNLIESQVELEKRLNNLAKARSQELLVYKDGRFQYVSDVDAVSAATAELEQYNREKLLEMQRQDIEDRRAAERADVEATIQSLEDKKEAYNKFLDDYQDYKTALNIEQKLGVKLEKDNFNTSLDNLKEYKDNYLSILNGLLAEQKAKLNEMATTRDQFNAILQSGGMAGGLQLDWNQDFVAKAAQEEILGGPVSDPNYYNPRADYNAAIQEVLTSAQLGGYEPWQELLDSLYKQKANQDAARAQGLISGYGSSTIIHAGIGWDSSDNEDYTSWGKTGTSTSSNKYHTSSGKSIYQNAYDSYISKGDYESANKVVEEAASRGQSVKRHATGTLSSSGGLSLVGENGPELRVLGHGDGIIPADITRNLWAWGSVTPAAMMSAFSGNFGAGKNMAVTIQNLNLPSVKDGNDFVQYMKNNFWRQTVQFATT